ncbi:MAG: TIGR03943 family putative permease subunit [Clostridium sp.]
MKRFNFDEFMWFITLILMAFSFLYIIYTGKIQFYIGDKMIKYIILAVFMIFVIAGFQVKNIFTPKNNINLKVKYIPILIALVIGFISIKSQDSFRHRQLNNFLINEYREDNHANNKNDNKSSEKGNYGEFIKIDNDNLNVLEEIQEDPDAFIGKELEMKGFVCRESYLKNTQFVIGRMIMTCCAADSKIVGILAEYDKIIDINENEWVTIKGSLDYTTINDDDGISHRVPIIRIDKLAKSSKS